MRTMYALKDSEGKYRRAKYNPDSLCVASIDYALLLDKKGEAVHLANRLYKDEYRKYTVVAVKVCREEMLEV